MYLNNIIIVLRKSMDMKAKAPIKTLYFDVDFRQFEMFFYPLSQTPPIKAKDLINFYNLWSNLRGEKRIPSRQDITFEALKGWHANIRLADLGESQLSPKQNLILGEIYKQYWGTETVYKQIIESDSVSDREKLKYEECMACFLKYNYGLSIGIAPNPIGSMRKIAWLDLPLSNGKNDDIAYLITALIPLDKR